MIVDTDFAESSLDFEDFLIIIFVISFVISVSKSVKLWIMETVVYFLSLVQFCKAANRRERIRDSADLGIIANCWLIV